VPPRHPLQDEHEQLRRGDHLQRVAGEEQRALGLPESELTPWWRVLKKDGFLNPKYPGGTEVQQALLEAEGVRVSPLRKKPAVFDFAERAPTDPLEKRV
jgi:hypothetical protein